jgi:nicotinamide-nucleotide amidase
LPYLTSHFSDLGTIQARVLHTFGLGESAVDELIADLEKLSNPTVGLLAHPGLVDIRITAKSTSSASATEMITEIENEIRKRIPDNIFGINEETLSSSILRLVEERNIPVSIIYSGFSQKPVFSSLKHKNFRIIGRSASPQKPVSFSELKKRVNLTEFSKDILVLCALTRLPDSVKIGIGFYSLGNEKIITSELSISPDLAEEWAKNVCLSALRIQLISSMEK